MMQKATTFDSQNQFQVHTSARRFANLVHRWFASYKNRLPQTGGKDLFEFHPGFQKNSNRKSSRDYRCNGLPPVDFPRLFSEQHAAMCWESYGLLKSESGY